MNDKILKEVICSLPEAKIAGRFDDDAQQLREDEFVAGWNMCLNKILQAVKQGMSNTVYDSTPPNYWTPKNNNGLTIAIESSKGVVKDIPIGQFTCTGLAPSLADVKAGKCSLSELGTIGYFRHPDGHLCSSHLYSEYKNL